MDRHGLLVGSMLTAIPFGLIHLPLAFEADGWTGTTWSEAFVNWAFLLGALPFLRYVIGVLLVDTQGSVLAAAMLHASFNASGALSVVPDGWQYVPALIILTVLVTVHRRLSGRSRSALGHRPDVPEPPAAAGPHPVGTDARQAKRLNSKGTHAMTKHDTASRPHTEVRLNTDRPLRDAAVFPPPDPRRVGRGHRPDEHPRLGHHPLARSPARRSGPVHRRTPDLLQRRVALDDRPGPHPCTP